MKKHQENFLSAHGSAEHIQDLLNQFKYKELNNPALNIDHVRYQLKHWDGLSKFPSVDRFQEVNPSSEDIHKAINSGWVDAALQHGLKNFNDSHVKRIVEVGNPDHIRHAVKLSSLNPDQQKHFFEGENPKFKRSVIGLGLSANKNLSKEQFDQIWDHSFSHNSSAKFRHEFAPPKIRYSLMIHHPDKVSKEQAKQLYDHGVTGVESTALRDHLTQEQWDTLRVK